MVKRQWNIFNGQIDQSQMSSIGSPTPLSDPKIDEEIIESQLQWVDCHYTRRDQGDIQITQSTNNNLVEQILLNPQLLPNRVRTSNSKVAIVFLKEKGVEHNKVPERPFASEVGCCRWSLYLIVPHIIIGLVLTGTCRQERCVRLHGEELSSRGRSVGR